MRRLSHFVLLFFSMLVACTSTNTAGDGGGGDGGDTLTADERATFDLGSEGAPAIVQLVSVTDRLFKFDPTLDNAKTAAENQTAIQGEITKNLGADPDGGPKCGSITAGMGTLTVNFGPLPGCMFAGITVSGSITLTISGGSMMPLTIGLTFASLTVNGSALSGTAMFTTANGTTFTITANLTTAQGTFTATNFTLTGSVGSVKLDGALATGSGDAGTTTMTFAGVVYKYGDCYPNAGTLTIKKGTGVLSPPAQIITFNAMTPTTGQITVTVGKKTTMTCLPPYGTCMTTCPKLDGG